MHHENILTVWACGNCSFIYFLCQIPGIRQLLCQYLLEFRFSQSSNFNKESLKHLNMFQNIYWLLTEHIKMVQFINTFLFNSSFCLENAIIGHFTAGEKFFKNIKKSVDLCISFSKIIITDLQFPTIYLFWSFLKILVLIRGN